MSNNGVHIISDVSTEATDNSDSKEKSGRGERAAIYLKGFDPTTETPPSSPLLSPSVRDLSPLSKPKFSVTDSSYSRTDALHLSRSYERPVSCLKVSSDGRDSDEELEEEKAEEGSRQARCGRVVSIQTSMWALSCVSMVVCVTTASVMLRQSYRTGLDDVHMAYDDEVQVIIAAGLKTQEEKTAQELLDVMSQISTSITTALIEAMSLDTFLTDVHTAYRVVDIRRSKQHFIASNNLTSAETLRLHFVGYESPSESAVLHVDDETNTTMDDLHKLDVQKYFANGSMILGQTNDSHFFFDSMHQRTLSQDFPYIASFLTNGLLHTGYRTFTQPTVRRGRVLFPFMHASSDGVIWFLGTAIELIIMPTAHSTKMRAYVTLRDDWVARRLRGSTNTSGHMLTASHGAILSPTTAGAEQVLLTPSESSDEQIRLMGKYYETHAPQEDVAINWSGRTLLYTLGKPLAGTNGIDLMVFASLNATQIHLESKDSFGSLQTSLVQHLSEIDDAILVKERDTSLVVSAIALALMACSVLLSILILRPLAKLQEMMNRVANMELDDLEIEESHLFEPRSMQRDFIAMVSALREYRAYVPKAVLNDGSWDAKRPKVPPPEGVIAILFTDIKGSTTLWRKDAEAMSECMDLHNATIRAVLAEYDGYEVKTVGDSFMVAFQDPVASVKCALKIQLKLAAQEWPEALNLPRGGLVVRAGLHYGQTMKEQNPNTGRTDYFGTTVNMASRLESTALGGTTCISSDVHALVLPLVDKLGRPLLHNYGSRDLKGLGQHLVYLICPARMANRVSEDTSDCNMRCNDARSRSSLSSKHSCPRSRAGSLTLENKRSGRAGSGSLKGKEKPKVQTPHHKISRTVMRSDLTVAVCQLLTDENQSDDQVTYAFNTMIFLTCDAAASTEGIVATVAGNSITVLWNASSICRNHSLAGLTFATQLQDRTDGVLRLGLATGSALHGNVGTAKNRFPAAFGVPLEAAQAMADFTLAFDEFCLFAACTDARACGVGHIPAGVLKLADIWGLPQDSAKVYIFALEVGQMRKALAVSYDRDEDEPSPCAPPSDKLIETYCADGDSESARQALANLRMLNEQHNDAVLKV